MLVLFVSRPVDCCRKKRGRSYQKRPVARQRACGGTWNRDSCRSGYDDSMFFPLRQLSTVAVGLIVLGFAVGCGQREAPEAAREDWSRPLDLPSRFPSAERLVAIGDLHGDLEAARGALALAGAIDGDDRWIGGNMVVEP